MFSSRNIHFAILGIILGASTGYVYAFYQAQRAAPTVQQVAANESGSGTPEHPDVTNDQMLALFNQALERNPNEPELMVRYANFLYDLGRYDEAVSWYQKVLAVQPENIDVRTDMGTALFSLGRTDESIAEYRKSLAINPNHMLTLHNMFVALLNGKRDINAAQSVLQKMESIDASYESLPTLKRTLEEARNQ